MYCMQVQVSYVMMSCVSSDPSLETRETSLHVCVMLCHACSSSKEHISKRAVPIQSKRSQSQGQLNLCMKSKTK